MNKTILLLAAIVSVLPLQLAMSAETADLLKTIKAVGNEGLGNVAASKAVAELSQKDQSALKPILAAFRGSNPLSANWLRSVFETIADRALKSGKALPAKELQQFILDTNQNPRARRLAFDWLLKVDKTADDRLIPNMLQDPSPEFRRDAVARLVAAADKVKDNEAQKSKAIEIFQQALTGATDDDQVKTISKSLKKLGVKVDLQKHFGFLPNWSFIGPFDNKEKKGYFKTYPPEKELKLDAAYKGELGEVQWQKLTSEDQYGIFDIAKALSPYKGAIMYATTEFVSNEKQQVELRLGTPNAWKMWVNGKLLFGREEYHRGMTIDQYRVPVTLNPGKNTILLKLCQNEQTESWAQRYQFQLRVCKASGIAVPAAKSVKTSQLNSNQLNSNSKTNLVAEGTK